MGFRGVIAAAALLLSGCEGGGRVMVTGTANDLRFSISDGKGRPGCADSVSVVPASPDDAAPLWQITAVNPALCIATLRYGSATDRFAEQLRAAPLRPGTLYRVRVSGAGFLAVQDFQITTGGAAQTR